MQDRPEKEVVEIAIDSRLLAEARNESTDLCEVLEQALRKESRARQWQRWRQENRASIEASNKELETNGLWCEDYRVW